MGLLRGNPDARVVAAAGKGAGSFDADRLQGFEVVTNWGGSNGPPQYSPRAKDVEYRDDSVRNGSPLLAVERLHADEIPNLRTQNDYSRS